MDWNALTDRIWHGEVPMADWTKAVTGGMGRAIAPDVLSVSTGYFFGNCTAIRTAEGLVVFDSGSRETARETVAAIRRWDDGPVHTIVYTHGHIDHTWGARLLDSEADARGLARPRILAHRNVLERFRRYDDTHGLNSVVMGRQFNKADYTFPGDHRRPDDIYDDQRTLTIGGRRIELMHGRGETDDATFAFLPDSKILLTGDFVIWAFPNAGNPRKVQRYAPDWAATLRRMRALNPEILLPGHGPAIVGAARAAELLEDGAAILDSLVGQTMALMNQGAGLDQILHAVKVPADLLAKPYLSPVYDDPEFVVRGIWHLYAGWYGGNPASLKPAPESDLAAELAGLAGGPGILAGRAATLAETGQLRLAAHLIEFAAGAAPGDGAIQAIRADIYARCMAREPSLIGKAIYGVAQREAQAAAKG
jgi:alkyl sulfatase BDS1-like metallo-beta-lactamase superfamily hydrolase